MQNFTLNVNQLAAIKSVDDANKSSLKSNKLNQNASNAQENSTAQNSFQSLLNKQVQAKRAQENVVSSKPNNKPVEKNTDGTAAKKNAQEAENLSEKKSGDEEGNAAQENLSTQLDFQRKDILLDHDLLLKSEDKRKIDADATILAAMMQEMNPVAAQANIDPAALKMYAQGVNQSGLSQDATKFDVEAQSADGISDAMQHMSKSAFGSEFLTGIATNQVNPTLDSTTQTPEANTKEPASFEDAVSYKFLGNDEISQEKAPQVLSALNTESLKTMTQKENALKEFIAQGEVKDLSNISAAQNFQQTNVAANQTATATQLVSGNLILVPFGKAGWDQAVSQKVVWMVGAGEQTATLTLNPPDLGPVQVVISVNNDQADTTFISDNADVRQALQDGLEHLREKMEASGIQLGQANVNSGQQSQQTFQEASQQQFAGSAITKSSSHLEPVSTMVVRESSGLVDIFA